MPRHAEVKVATGEIVAYRLFDIADSIDLSRAEVALRTGILPRLTFTRTSSHYIELPYPPATIVLGPQQIQVGGATIACESYARIFDFGAVSIQLRVPIARGTPFHEVVTMASAVDGSVDVEQTTRRLCDDLAHRLAQATGNPHHWGAREEYTVFFFREFTPTLDADAAIERLDIPRLLLPEPNSDAPLSAHERDDVLKWRFSYFENDIVVIDWNSAFVLEPSGARDVPDVLEFATTQLLELRYYDALLDRELAQIYDEFESLGGRRGLTNIGRYTKLSRRLMRLSVEISEITERIDNSLKVIGDFSLARVYQAAVNRFRIDHWRNVIDRKEAAILQISTLLHQQLTTSRTFLMETLIVLLIAVEIVLLVVLAK